MAAFVYIVAVFCVAVRAAPPPRYYGHQQRLNPLDYYLDNPDAANYYDQTQQKQVNGQSDAPSRLETLEPDSEVELIPGAQTPQQPPQQTPVSPNLPGGLVPGQRVYIVHMPVPGYRPGTIGGYQPVYIVAAAPQGNSGAGGYVANGYQNAILLDPSGQTVLSPVNGYYRPTVAQPGNPGVLQQPGNPNQLHQPGNPILLQQPGNPGLLLGGPLGLNRPYNFLYPDADIPYQQGGLRQAQQTVLAQLNAPSQPAHPASTGSSEASANNSKRSGKSSESKESEEPRSSGRAAHAQPRKP